LLNLMVRIANNRSKACAVLPPDSSLFAILRLVRKRSTIFLYFYSTNIGYKKFNCKFDELFKNANHR